MHLAREPNAKSGCSDFRNSPLPSSGTRPKYQTCQNRVRSDLAVPADKDAWREADRLGLSVRINEAPARVSFHFLAEHYLKADFGADALRPKSVNTISHVEQVVRAYLVPRFGHEIAEDIKPFDIQRWLKSLHETNGLAWTTISKMRGVMHRIYKIGILHEHVAKNPVQHVETRSKSDYKAIVITPPQTLAI